MNTVTYIDENGQETTYTLADSVPRATVVLIAVLATIATGLVALLAVAVVLSVTWADTPH